jgi:hypothetical protein
MIEAPHPGTTLIFAIRATSAWWRKVGENLGFDAFRIVTDIRDDRFADFNILDDFYAAYRPLYRTGATQSDLLTSAEVEDIIARCRVLRWLPKRRAAAMALAMAVAYDKVLTACNPSTLVAFPIDRYTSDVLARLAEKRGLPFFELTASAIENYGMLLFRGRLVRNGLAPDPAEVEKHRLYLSNPNFTPNYVRKSSVYTPSKWLKVFGYFRLRGWVFRAIAILHRDPLSLHYTDAQAFLGHKPSLSDVRITHMLDADWREKVEAHPKEKRFFLALQLFPEASIDYWIDDIDLIEHEDLLFEMATAFSNAGYLIMVKDHPLQFGFRQVAFLDRLRTLPDVVLIPYDISGNELLSMSGVTFTCTGTLGMQAVLYGIPAIVTPNYYSNDQDFILLNGRNEVQNLPAKVAAWSQPADLIATQTRIIADLLRGSFVCDFFSFQKFDPENPHPGAAALGKILGAKLRELGPNGENWHAKPENRFRPNCLTHADG